MKQRDLPPRCQPPKVDLEKLMVYTGEAGVSAPLHMAVFPNHSQQIHVLGNSVTDRVQARWRCLIQNNKPLIGMFSAGAWELTSLVGRRFGLAVQATQRHLVKPSRSQCVLGGPLKSGRTASDDCADHRQTRGPYFNSRQQEGEGALQIRLNSA